MRFNSKYACDAPVKVRGANSDEVESGAEPRCSMRGYVMTSGQLA